jgi:hypothetical protein
MKKTVLITVIILTSALVFSFTEKHNIDEVIITITSDKPAKFDMRQDSVVVKGLTTPHEIKLRSTNSRFIFKSTTPKANVTIEAKKKGAKITASWPITVLLINENELSTFGID